MSCANASVGTLDPDQVQQVLATAELAPAVHHIHPWRFRCTTSTIEMLMDDKRDLSDDDHREARVASGAALLNLRLAVRSFGVEPVVHLMPELDRPSLLAAIEIDGRRPITDDGLEMSMAIGLLATCDGPLSAGSPPDALIAELRHAARTEQAWIALLPMSALSSLRELVDRSGWLRLREPSAQVVVVGTLQDDPSSRLRAGQAMQRVLLTATRAGLGACLLALSPDAANREQLRQLIGGALWPQALLQIGRSSQ